MTSMSTQDIIEALKICKCNEDDEPCKQCPVREKEWDGAWENALGICYVQLMRQAAEVLSYTVQTTPEPMEEQDMTKCEWIQYIYDGCPYDGECENCEAHRDTQSEE